MAHLHLHNPARHLLPLMASARDPDAETDRNASLAAVQHAGRLLGSHSFGNDHQQSLDADFVFLG
jgi:hypothetical protein